MTLTVSNSALAQTYKRHPIGFTRGEGVWLFDESGKKYLDLTGRHRRQRPGPPGESRHPAGADDGGRSAQASASTSVATCTQTPVGEKLAQSPAHAALLTPSSSATADDGGRRRRHQIRPQSQSPGTDCRLPGAPLHGRSSGSAVGHLEPEAIGNRSSHWYPGVQWADSSTT